MVRTLDIRVRQAGVTYEFTICSLNKDRSEVSDRDISESIAVTTEISTKRFLKIPSDSVSVVTKITATCDYRFQDRVLALVEAYLRP